jgi:hypothetical protein
LKFYFPSHPLFSSPAPSTPAITSAPGGGDDGPNGNGSNSTANDQSAAPAPSDNTPESDQPAKEAKNIFNISDNLPFDKIDLIVDSIGLRLEASMIPQKHNKTLMKRLLVVQDMPALRPLTASFPLQVKYDDFHTQGEGDINSIIKFVRGNTFLQNEI